MDSFTSAPILPAAQAAPLPSQPMSPLVAAMLGANAHPQQPMQSPLGSVGNAAQGMMMQNAMMQRMMGNKPPGINEPIPPDQSAAANQGVGSAMADMATAQAPSFWNSPLQSIMGLFQGGGS